MKAKKSQQITAVRYDRQQRMVEFKTNTGKIYNYETAKEAIDLSIIDNAKCYTSADGTRKIMLDQSDLPEF